MRGDLHLNYCYFQNLPTKQSVPDIIHYQFFITPKTRIMDFNKNTIFSTLGWAGTFLILIAFFANSLSFISSTSMIYQIMNLLGSVGIFTVAFYKKDYPPAFLNLIWFLISLFAIVKILFKF